MILPKGKSRLDLVKAGISGGLAKRGRLVVSLDRLLEDPKNERKTFRNMAGLIESVKKFGVIEPITVTAEGEGYRILTGHRRARAARAAGLSEIEVLIRDPEDAHRRRRKSIVSNVQREDVGPVEMAEALQSLLDEDPEIKTQADLARILGKTEEWVSGMLRVLSLPAELQEKVRLSQLSLSYDAMIRIARVKDKEEQNALVNAALNGVSTQEIRRRIKENKQGSQTMRVSERLDEYLASVHGPADRLANAKMRAAVEALLEKLKLENS